MSVRQVVKWTVLGVSVTALLGGCAGSRPDPAPAAPTVASGTPTDTRRCVLPSVRPTSLPWQRSGELPEPSWSYDEEIDRAQLSWTNPKNPQDGVGLTIYPLDDSVAPEEPLGVKIQGVQGYLHDGSMGENSAWWDLDQRCNFLELSVSLEGVPSERVDEEVIKVARSLE